MMRKTWLALAVALAGLAQGCQHQQCCRRPLFPRLRSACRSACRPACPAPVACCHGGDLGPPAVIGAPLIAVPLPPGPPPLAR